MEKLSAFKVKELCKGLLPPIVLGALRFLRRKFTENPPSHGIEFVGHYSVWDMAVKNSLGYGHEQILEKVRAATAKVRDGEAAFERDSVVFEKPAYPFPLIAILLRVATENDGCLTVLDFGGALGSSYYQCKKFLFGVKKLRWCVVEQPHFVRCGRESFEQDELHFFDSINDCVKRENPNLLLLSGVLQYVEKPVELLKLVAETGTDYIMIDRTPFSASGDYLAIQVVPPSLYQASYPIWLFKAETVLEQLNGKYTLIAEFDALDGTIGQGENRTSFKGMIFKKISLSQTLDSHMD